MPYHRGMILPLALLLLASPAQPSSAATALWLGRSAELALACVHKSTQQDRPRAERRRRREGAARADPRVLRVLRLAFVRARPLAPGRVARLAGDAPFAARARAALDKSITAANIAAEVRYLNGAGRVSFERPYGLAWLLQLQTELHEWATERPADADVGKWAETLEPLTSAAISRIADWLPKLTAPIRIGEHSQRPFVRIDARLGARDEREETGVAGAVPLARLVPEGSRVPLAYEPSGEDSCHPAWRRPT